VPKTTLFAVFSGLAKGLSEQKLAPFIANLHVALWVLAATSLLGAAVCLMRPRHVNARAQRGRRPQEAPLVALPARVRAPAPLSRAAEHNGDGAAANGDTPTRPSSPRHAGRQS
jgi:hypothetical protein